MKGRILTILSALSLLLFVATGVGWVRSYITADLLQYYRTVSVNGLMDDQESYQFSSGNGGWSVEWGMTRFVYSSPQEAAQIRQQSGYVYDGRFQLSWMKAARWYGGPIYRPQSAWHLLGFEYRCSGARPNAVVEVTMPWAVPLMVVGAYPGWRAWRAWRTRRRFAAGRCQSCGYDLRASKERCPECGAAIPTKTGDIPPVQCDGR